MRRQIIVVIQVIVISSFMICLCPKTEAKEKFTGKKAEKPFGSSSVSNNSQNKPVQVDNYFRTSPSGTQIPVKDHFRSLPGQGSGQ
jgi:hypothetical protein